MLRCALALFVFLLLAGGAAAQDTTLPDFVGRSPVFVELPTRSTEDPSGKDRITLFFATDWDRCRDHYGSENWDKCQPLLGLYGTRAEVPMEPPLPGVWRWEGDDALAFTPDTPWQAGQTYTATIDLDALGVPARVLDMSWSGAWRSTTSTIQAAPLKVDIRDMRFMQDPDNPAKRLVAARLETNYQVAPEELKKRIAFTLVEDPGSGHEKRTGPLPLTFTLAKDGKSAEVAVVLKDLPARDGSMELSIVPGLPPATGGAATVQTFAERARVPSLGTYLAVEGTSAAVSRAGDGTPGHVLALTLNVKVAPEVVRGATKACLLPFAHPAMRSAPNEPHKWRAENEATQEILKDCAPVDLAPMPGDVGEVTQFAFGFDAPAGRYLYVEVAKDLRAFGGYTLERAAQRVVPVPSLPNDVEIVQKGAVLPLTGARTLLLRSRGVDALNVEVAQVAPAALAHFIAQTEGDITSPDFRGWSFAVEDVATIATARLPMAYRGPTEAQYAGFDLGPYLAGGKKGMFLLTIAGERSGKVVGEAERRFVLVSDLGLVAKMAGEGGGDAFVLSFAKGAPAAGAEVSVLGRSGAEIFRAKTDKAGRVALPDLAAYTRDREPVAIVAQQGQDYAFLPYDRLGREMDLSAFDVGGARTPYKGLAALVFADRGIYRPGEAAEIGLLLRDADGRPPGGAIPLVLTVRDPAGRVVVERPMGFSGPGLEAARVQTGQTWPTGPYTASLAIPGEKGGDRGEVLGEATFRVEDFVPDRLKIAVRLAPAHKGWLSPESLSAEVDLANLYGTPASDREVRGHVDLDPANIRFDLFRDYTFFDAYAAPPRRVSYDLAPAQTDEAGRAALALNLEVQEAASYTLALAATGFDAGGGRGVSAYATALVSPAPYMLGWRTDATLSYLRKDDKALLDVIALTPDLAPAAPEGLTARLLRMTQVSSLIQRADGAYAYETVPREEALGDPQPFAVGPVDLPTADIGDFVWQVEDTKERVVLRVPFSVVGAGTRAGGLDRAAVLHIATDKADYPAGGEIEVAITAPYAGAGLITLEAGRVLAARWFTATGTDSVERIAIPPGFTGKGYVSVAFVRNADSPEIAASPLAYAVTPFTAGVEDRRLGIVLDGPERAESGAEVAITYSAPAPGKAVVWAVDAGILQVARYELPDPLTRFLLDRALGVRTFQMLDLIMPDYALVRRLAAEGGSAEPVAAALGAYINPFKRNDLPPAVYWSGVVDVGPQPRTLTFAPPAHFNGTLKIMALGAGADRLGSAEREVLVRGDVVVTPVLPAFLAPGDVVVGSVTVANDLKGSGPDAALALSIEVDGGAEVTTPPPVSLPVPEGAERSASFTLTATHALGPAEVTIRATLGEGTFSATLPLSVRPPVARETTLQAGFAAEGKASIAPQRTLYAQGDPQQTLAASALPTAYIAGLRRYLMDFPYGCTEQVVSAAFPSVGLDGPEDAAARERVDKALGILRARQTGDGGFALWDGGLSSVDSFASLYALDFLLTARDAGFPVPQEVVDAGLRWARAFVNQDIQDDVDAHRKAYGIYLLTRSGIVTTNEILHWRDFWASRGGQDAWRTDVSAVYIAGAHKMLRQDALAAEVLDAFAAGGLTAQAANWGDREATPALAHAQYVYVLAQHFPERFAAMDRRVVWDLAGFVADGWYNTVTAAWGIRALQAYAAKQERDAGLVAVTADGAAVEGGVVPVGAKEVTIKADGGGPLFYTFTQSGFTQGAAAAPMAEGLEISRAYGTQTPVRLGDVVEAVVTIRAQERAVEDVVIVDLIPAGFALERHAPGGNLDMQAVEARGDRLVAFADVAPGRDQTLTYRLRAVAVGSFAVPAPYAQAMYDPRTAARGVTGRIDVTDAP